MRTVKIFLLMCLALSCFWQESFAKVNGYEYRYDFAKDGVFYKITSPNTVAVSNEKYVDTYDGGHMWSGYSGDVVIPSTVTYENAAYTVTSIGDYAFWDEDEDSEPGDPCPSKVTSVTLPNTIVSIGKYAFRDCDKITLLTIPNSVKTIADAAFSHCSSLKNVTMSSNVKNIGASAFSSCSSLTGIALPQCLDSIGAYAFSGCSLISSFTISDNVKFIGGKAFERTAWYNNQPDGMIYAGKLLYAYKGTAPSSISIQSGCKGIVGYAFYNQKGLQSVNMPNSVTYIGEYAFCLCSGITSINLSTSLVSIEKDAFENCSGLTSVSLPNSVKKIASMAFYKCSSIATLNIPSSVTYIGGDAFHSCTGLKELTLPNSELNVYYNAFAYCSNLTTIYMDCGENSYFLNPFYGCTSLSRVVIKDLKDWASIKYDNTSSNPLSYAHHLYMNNEEIIDLVLPKITNIAKFAFVGGASFKTLTLPENLETISEYAFYGCSGITSITIPASVTTIEEGAFKKVNYTNSYIKTITCKGTVPPSLGSRSSDYVFSLTSSAVIYVPDGYSSAYKETDWGYCFYNKIRDSHPSLTATPAIPATCTTAGNAAYWTCTGCHKVYSDQNGVNETTVEASTIASLGHEYGNPEWTWADNGKSASAKITCKHDNSHYITGNATITETVKQAATCTEKGTTTYSASVVLNNTEYKSSKDVQDIVALGHNLSSTDNGDGTHTTVCSRCDYTSVSNHVFEDNVCTSCDKPAFSLSVDDLIALSGSTPTLPIHMDNSKEICNLQFDITLPAGIDIFYGENEDEEEVYWVTKGERAKEAHTVTVQKLGDRKYRVLMSSMSNAVFKDADKSLPIAYVKLDVSSTLAPGDYNIQLTNIHLTNYNNGTTTSIDVADATAKVTVPPAYSIAVACSPASYGSVNVSGDNYDDVSKNTTYGSSVTLTATPNEGYHFVKWTEGSATLSTDNPYKLNNISADHTVKAVFDANQYYITFTVDGAEYSKGLQTFGNIVTTPTNPSKTGYTFTGWKNLSSTTTVPAHDVTYEAVFTINQYTVRFIADGVDVYNQKQDFGSAIVAPEAPAKSEFVFITWGEVAETVPAADVTYTAEYALLGDLYEDDKINVADLTSLVGIILSDDEISDRKFKMANVYIDEYINVADYTNLVGMIMKAPSAANAKSQELVSLNPQLTAAANGTSLELSLANSAHISAWQFDIALPSGVELLEDGIEAKGMSQHSVTYRKLADGRYRVVVCSPSNSIIGAKNRLNLKLTSDNDIVFGEAVISHNVCASELQAVHLDDLTVVLVANATGISGISGHGGLIVSRCDGGLSVKSCKDQAVRIYTEAGVIVYDAEMAEDETRTIRIPKGVYVVNGNKLIVR